MTHQTAKDYAAYKHMAEDSFEDICNILHTSYTTGSYSDDEVAVITGSYNVSCGFYMTNGQMRKSGQLVLVNYDAIVRLSLEQTVDIDDQIELVQKGGQLVSGTYVPQSPPEIGPSVITVRLVKVV